MDYFVTGGAGFIGSNYVRMLLNDEFGVVSTVTVLDKLTYAGNIENLRNVLADPRLTFIQGDICDLELVRTSVMEGMIVVHFAAESHVDRSISGPDEFIRTNIAGTQNLLQVSIDVGVKTFLHVSTDEVYGSVEIGSSVETDPLWPNSPYAASKASSDLIARSYFKTYGHDIRITRCCNNYGPYQFPEKLIPLFITNLLLDLPIPVYGNGRNIREWIHVNDHCRAIQLVIDSGKPGEIYNIGSGFRLENIEIARRIIVELGKNIDLLTFVEDRKGHDLRYALDSRKINNELGFTPSYNFDPGLQEVVKWFQDNSSWWKRNLNK